MPVAELLFFAESSWIEYLPFTLNLLIIIVSVFLMLLVLIQKGKGGGLAGAFGGMGGSSAFGSRAGDQFTKVTLVTALVWVLLIMLMVKTMPRHTTAAPPPQSISPVDQQPPAENENSGRWRPEAVERRA